MRWRKQPPKSQPADSPLSRFFGKLELAVMEIIWAQGPASVATVLKALNAGEPHLAYTTVMTVMSRLAAKGWLLAEKHGRAYVYRAAYSRPEAEAQAVGGVLRALLQDFGQVAVAQFIKELDELDPAQLAQLAKFIQDREAHDDGDS